MAQFQLTSEYTPTGDQPQAIEKLARGVEAGAPHQVLLGVTGSGKTYSISNVIARTQRPTLIIEPNKTLAAQTFQELKEFFPRNGVHYFVSYYDYYQPEAYIPQTDTYIEKDAKINETIDRLRHEAVQDLLTRRDCIVVASVSCIYNIGSPEEYQKVSLELREGQGLSRRELLAHLASLQYERNDVDFAPGRYRLRGDSVEVYAVTGREVIRAEFLGSKVERLSVAPPSLAPQEEKRAKRYRLFPAKFWVTSEDRQKLALQNIRSELAERLRVLKGEGKNLAAERLEQRTNYDLDMIQESGYCHGIENYSAHMEFRSPGDPPFTLLDYFPQDVLVVGDESHLTYPQLRAMAVQDSMRKESLVEHGFRLPSAIDNRPLTFEEFLARARRLISLSATPGAWEQERAGAANIAEQLVRPTGLLEPVIEVRPSKNQVADATAEIRKAREKGQRSLVITLTKRLAEDIASHLTEQGIATQWLHSEVKTLERPRHLEELRAGAYDVIVGVNLLREGLDLPEVALVAILDADKEGFLRNKTTLVQTMGRAARHPEGRALLYADKETESMKAARAEVERRRNIQERYNKEHGITPRAVRKGIREWGFLPKKEAAAVEFAGLRDPRVIEREMRAAAKNLDFERAAQLRDLLKEFKGATKHP